MDNLLKAVVDAISEEMNDLGGLLITRLKQAHDFGRNDGLVAAADPDRLTSPIDVFTSAMAGDLIDVLHKPTPTGNEGTYSIGTFVDPKNVDLLKIGDGAAATFVNESSVRWRFSDLQVETTLAFPTADKVQRLWVGDEALVTPYGGTVLVPGGNKFRGIGEQVYRLDGAILVANPQELKTIGEFFTADMVGHAAWVLPKPTSTGNEGARRITAVVDSRTATLAGPAFVGDETDVRLVVKTHERIGDGYLTKRHRELTEVIDGSQSYSLVDRLRRAMLCEYAVAEELDRIGRRLVVTRTRTMDDETYRRFLKVRAYLPAGTVYGLELLLAALFPQGGWAVYEDRVNFPDQVFLTLPSVALGQVSEGRAILASSGPFPPASVGRRGMEQVTSSSSTSVTVSHSVLTPVSVELEDVAQTLEMALLPSADAPASAFVNEGQTEGATFTLLANNVLQHDQSAATNPLGGRYERAIVEFGGSDHLEISAWFRVQTFTGIGARPFHLALYDGVREYNLTWSFTQAAYDDGDGTNTVVGPSAAFPTLADTKWHLITLRRRGAYIESSFDGVDILGPAPVSAFAATASFKASFGYFNVGIGQNWIAEWARVYIYEQNRQNFWNLSRADGALAGSPAVQLSSALGLYLAGDNLKRVRLKGTEDKNRGVWLATYVSATQLDLDGIVRGGAAVATDIVTLSDPWLRPEDAPKTITISGSASLPTNDGDYPILALGGAPGLTGADALLTPRQARVDVTGHPNGVFGVEFNLDWKFKPDFAAEASIPWELVDAGSAVGAVLTLRDALPQANQPVRVWYTAVESSQILRSEFTTNDGSGGSEPNIYYPFYLSDVDTQTRAIFDDATAAGVIPDYERPF